MSRFFNAFYPAFKTQLLSLFQMKTFKWSAVLMILWLILCRLPYGIGIAANALLMLAMVIFGGVCIFRRNGMREVVAAWVASGIVILVFGIGQWVVAVCSIFWRTIY